MQFRVRQRFDEHIEHPRRVLIGIARIGGQETGYEIGAFLFGHANPLREYIPPNNIAGMQRHIDGTTIQQEG